jgi:hypothetical protein
MPTLRHRRSLELDILLGLNLELVTNQRQDAPLKSYRGARALILLWRLGAVPVGPISSEILNLQAVPRPSIVPLIVSAHFRGPQGA